MVKFQVYNCKDGKPQPVLSIAEGSLAYCNGWVDAMDSMYPSKACMIIRHDTKSGELKVVRETKGRGKAHVSCGGEFHRP
jgi:hypothetical protein